MNLKLRRRRRRRQQPLGPALRFSPYAWAKLLFLRDLGGTEVGGFGVSAAEDLLLVQDICLVRQVCGPFTVRFDDGAVADFFDEQVDRGLVPERFGRIWVHTHPGDSARPSVTDEETFQRCFGQADWALMFILARGGATSARFRLHVGPGAELPLPVEVDFDRPFPASQAGLWAEEYRQCVMQETLLPSDGELPHPRLDELPDAWDGGGPPQGLADLGWEPQEVPHA